MWRCGVGGRLLGLGRQGWATRDWGGVGVVCLGARGRVGAGTRKLACVVVGVGGGRFWLGLRYAGGSGAVRVRPRTGVVSQFDAPLATFGGLEPLAPATVKVGGFPGAVVVSPDGRSAYVLKGDKVSQYIINPATGRLSTKSPATVATGSNPAAMAVTSNEQERLRRQQRRQHGLAVQRQPDHGEAKRQDAGDRAHRKRAVAVAVSPDGKSAYVVNNGDHTVSQYTMNASTGKLSPKSPATVSTGSDPGGLAVTPDGKSAYVANFVDNTVSQYSIDPSTGKLSPKTPATVPTGDRPSRWRSPPTAPPPTSIDDDDYTISQYSIDPSTGKLSATTPATVATGGNPQGDSDQPRRQERLRYRHGRRDDLAIQHRSHHRHAKRRSRPQPSPSEACRRDRGHPRRRRSVKISAPASVKSGSDLTYTIKVSNAGPSSAWQVVLRDAALRTQFLKRPPAANAPHPKPAQKAERCAAGHDQGREAGSSERGQNHRQRRPGCASPTRPPQASPPTRRSNNTCRLPFRRGDAVLERFVTAGGDLADQDLAAIYELGGPR